MNIKSNSFVVFDLDDTLYKEIDFLKSAYLEIAKVVHLDAYEELYNLMLDNYYKSINVFDWLTKNYESSPSKQNLIELYRNHSPNIRLSKGVSDFIKQLKNSKTPIGLITDGRSVTQRNKLRSLGIINLFEDKLISEEFGSEKPSIENYLHYQNKFKSIDNFYYIGDNFTKDFVSPNKLKWDTIGLIDDGSNIHKQSKEVPHEYLPKYYIKDFSEISLT